MFLLQTQEEMQVLVQHLLILNLNLYTLHLAGVCAWTNRPLQVTEDAKAHHTAPPPAVWTRFKTSLCQTCCKQLRFILHPSTRSLRSAAANQLAAPSLWGSYHSKLFTVLAPQTVEQAPRWHRKTLETHPFKLHACSIKLSSSITPMERCSRFSDVSEPACFL